MLESAVISAGTIGMPDGASSVQLISMCRHVQLGAMQRFAPRVVHSCLLNLNDSRFLS